MAQYVLDQLARWAHERGNACAAREYRSDGTAVSLTFSDLNDAVRDVAAHVRASVAPGGAILLTCGNGLDCLIAFFGVLQAGCTVFPLHLRSTAAELMHAAGVSGAQVMIGPESSALSISEAAPLVRFSTAEPGCALWRIRMDQQWSATAGRAETLRLDGAGLMLQSSGTTGLPKVVYRNGASLDAVARNVAEAVGLHTRDGVLVVIPMGHSYGVENALLGPLTAGACIHVLPRFDAGPTLHVLVSGTATVFPGVPSVFETLGYLPAPGAAFPRLRQVYSAGTILPLAVQEAFARHYHRRIGQVYGSSEIGSVTFNDPAGEPFDPMSVGRPMSGVEVHIAATNATAPDGEGEVRVRAPSMLSAYVDGHDLELVDGYFSTGDLGRVDKQGRLTITGRIRLLIDVGGLKVNPLEVEQVLTAHAQIAECMVVAARVSETVCRLKAIVVPRDPAAVFDEQAVRRFVRNRLAPYKVPRIFELRESLPKSATGKILREQL